VSQGKTIGANPNLYKRKNRLSGVNFLGGSALYRREALIEAGGFNPYLRSAEENELGQRLRKNGHRLLSIPVNMITHHTGAVGEWAEFLRKDRMNLFLA